jgi:hypothetical protein
LTINNNQCNCAEAAAETQEGEEARAGDEEKEKENTAALIEN